MCLLLANGNGNGKTEKTETDITSRVMNVPFKICIGKRKRKREEKQQKKTETAVTLKVVNVLVDGNVNFKVLVHAKKTPVLTCLQMLEDGQCDTPTLIRTARNCFINDSINFFSRVFLKNFYTLFDCKYYLYSFNFVLSKSHFLL